MGRKRKNRRRGRRKRPIMKLIFNIMIERGNVNVSSFEKLTIILVSYSV
jgi:hypothetical protein